MFLRLKPASPLFFPVLPVSNLMQLNFCLFFLSLPSSTPRGAMLIHLFANAGILSAVTFPIDTFDQSVSAIRRDEKLDRLLPKTGWTEKETHTEIKAKKTKNWRRRTLLCLSAKIAGSPGVKLSSNGINSRRRSKRRQRREIELLPTKEGARAKKMKKKLFNHFYSIE